MDEPNSAGGRPSRRGGDLVDVFLVYAGLRVWLDSDKVIFYLFIQIGNSVVLLWGPGRAEGRKLALSGAVRM